MCKRVLLNSTRTRTVLGSVFSNTNLFLNLTPFAFEQKPAL